MDTNHPTNMAPVLFVGCRWDRCVPAVSGLPNFKAAHPSLSAPVIAAPLLLGGLPAALTKAKSLASAATHGSRHRLLWGQLMPGTCWVLRGTGTVGTGQASYWAQTRHPGTAQRVCQSSATAGRAWGLSPVVLICWVMSSLAAQ